MLHNLKNKFQPKYDYSLISNIKDKQDSIANEQLASIKREIIQLLDPHHELDFSLLEQVRVVFYDSTHYANLVIPAILSLRVANNSIAINGLFNFACTVKAFYPDLTRYSWSTLIETGLSPIRNNWIDIEIGKDIYKIFIDNHPPDTERAVYILKDYYKFEFDTPAGALVKKGNIVRIMDNTISGGYILVGYSQKNIPIVTNCYSLERGIVLFMEQSYLCDQEPS